MSGGNAFASARKHGPLVEGLGLRVINIMHNVPVQ